VAEVQDRQAEAVPAEDAMAEARQRLREARRLSSTRRPRTDRVR
jgi:hypothetical protein